MDPTTQTYWLSDGVKLRAYKLVPIDASKELTEVILNAAINAAKQDPATLYTAVPLTNIPQDVTTKTNASYLGDSVYACIADGMIKLYLDNGYGPQDTIYLEPEVAKKLQVYITQQLPT